MTKKSIHYRADKARSKVLHAAARLFLEKGYHKTTLRELASLSGVNYGSLAFVFKSKENILSDLVGLVLDFQFEFTSELLKGITDDKILFYAVETVLQLHLAESGEHIRELYTLSYSQHASSDVVYNKITQKLSEIFKDQYSHFTQREFYEKELASAGIMRNYMTRPCGAHFTMDRKVKAFLENTFLLYEIQRSKIMEATEFVSRFDFKILAGQVIDNLLSYLESKT